jgi:SNF2 family DNA or RNA helicase
MVIKLNSDSAQHPLQCSDIKVELKPHQLAAIHRCLELESHKIPLSEMPLLNIEFSNPRRTDNQASNYVTTRIGIIGDKVGAGKSFVVLGMVSESKIKTATESTTDREGLVVDRSYGYNMINIRMEYPLTPVDATIIVVPYNLIQQWTTYVESFDGGLSHIIINRSKHLENLSTSDLYSKDLIIVSSTFFNNLAKHFLGTIVRRLVFDEADNITTSLQHNLKARFSWFVTASFENLVYPYGHGYRDELGIIRSHQGVRSSGWIRNLFTDLTHAPRRLLESVVVMNEDEFVDQSYTLQPPKGHVIECKTPIEVHVLNGMHDCYSKRILQYLNAHDMESAINAVSSSQKGSETNIVNLLIERLERQLHNLKLQLSTLDSQMFETEAERVTKHKSLTEKIDDTQGKIRNIQERIKDADNCCICYGEIANRTVTVCCSNVFCFECINRWISRSPICPLCKSHLSTTKLLLVQDLSATFSEKCQVAPPPCKTKLETMTSIVAGKIEAGERFKVLIFSEYENSFQGIMPELDALDVSYKCLKGNSAQISKTIQQYKMGNLDILMVNSSFYGTGLNLENTTDIIIFHKVADELERQIIGRAQRCGRDSVLNVWYLYHSNEISPAV